ncbi:MAG: signal peptide peptidase SppA, partial [Allomuricauda sp.]
DLGDFGIRKYPKYKSDFQRFMDDMAGAKSKMGAVLIQEEIGGEAYRILKEFKNITEQKGIQARMPFSFNIK